MTCSIEYYTRTFIPRKTLLEKIPEDAKQSAAEKADKIILEHLSQVEEKHTAQAAQINQLMTQM